MSKSGTFLGTKVDGKPKIWDRAGMDAAFAAYGDGEDFQVTVEEVSRKRTRAQEKFFHGPVLKAFMSMGWAKQEAKDMLCLRFIPQEIRQMDGSIVLVPGHTSALDVPAYSDLIADCIQLAAENDVVVEDSDEWRRKRQREAREAERQEPSTRELQSAYRRVSKVANAGKSIAGTDEGAGA